MFTKSLLATLILSATLFSAYAEDDATEVKVALSPKSEQILNVIQSIIVDIAT